MERKSFTYFMIFITVVVVPIALFYFMLTGRMNNLSPTQVAVIELYMAIVCVELLLIIVNWFIKL